MIRRAITRRPGANAGKGLTTQNLGSPDIPGMLAQHRAYVSAFESLGVAVDVLEADERYPDSCFVEDTAVVTADCAVITRPGAPSRRGEIESIEPVLAPLRDLLHIEAPGCLEGGDVILAGRHVLIGLSARTNAEGARQLGEILGARGMAVRTVPVTGALHLKTDVNPIGSDRLLLTRAYAGRSELAGFEQIVVPDGEEYAANSLFFGDTALLPAGFPRTCECIERLGFEVVTIDVSEFQKMDGGLSCLSLRF